MALPKPPHGAALLAASPSWRKLPVRAAPRPDWCRRLTFEEAGAFNTAFLQDVAANILCAARHADIAGYMAFGPPGAELVGVFRADPASRNRTAGSLVSESRRLPVQRDRPTPRARTCQRRSAQLRQPDIADFASRRDRQGARATR